MVDIKKLINTETGKIIISAVMGIGLACLFRKVCTDKNCIAFHGPVITDIENKTFKHGHKCYKYNAVSEKCDSTKRIIDITERGDGVFS